jgi:hypothetical protein
LLYPNTTTDTIHDALLTSSVGHRNPWYASWYQCYRTDLYQFRYQYLTKVLVAVLLTQYDIATICISEDWDVRGWWMCAHAVRGMLATYMAARKAL